MPSKHTVTSSDLIGFVDDNWSSGRNIAQKFQIDELNLKTSALLYLPRLVHGALPAITDYEAELERIAQMLRERQQPCLEWVQPPTHAVADVKSFRLVDLCDDEARIFHERFHYVGSYRPNCANFGLAHPETGRIACLASVSRFDVANLIERIRPIAAPESVMMLSRFLAFRWAPRNAFSFMFSRVARIMKQHHRHLQAITTYLNPNLGFAGASYNPSEWRPLAHERGTRYHYVDGRYMTVRDLIRDFGTFDRSVLKAKLGLRFETSSLDLQPLRVLVYPFSKTFARKLPETPFLVERPERFDDLKLTS